MLQRETPLLEDFNARLGARSNTLQRTSPDDRALPHGTAIVARCEDLGLEVLNGTSHQEEQSRNFVTFMQHAGSSVIDLASPTRYRLQASPCLPKVSHGQTMHTSPLSAVLVETASPRHRAEQVYTSRRDTRHAYCTDRQPLREIDSLLQAVLARSQQPSVTSIYLRILPFPARSPRSGSGDQC